MTVPTGTVTVTATRTVTTERERKRTNPTIPMNPVIPSIPTKLPSRNNDCLQR